MLIKFDLDLISMGWKWDYLCYIADKAFEFDPFDPERLGPCVEFYLGPLRKKPRFDEFVNHSGKIPFRLSCIEEEIDFSSSGLLNNLERRFSRGSMSTLQFFKGRELLKRKYQEFIDSREAVGQTD